VPTSTASRKFVRSSCLLRYTTFHALLYSTTSSCSLDDGEQLPVDDDDDGELSSCVVFVVLGSGVEGVVG